jgi:hypothetical protein
VKHSQRPKGQKKILISKSEMRKKESSNERHRIHQWDGAGGAFAA